MISLPATTIKPRNLISMDEFKAIALMFPIGARVRYLDSADNEHGQGQVTAQSRSTNDALITVQFDTLGTHNILSRFLEIV